MWKNNKKTGCHNKSIFGRTQRPHKTHQINDRGFTLIELLIGIAIMGILVAFAIPQYREYTEVRSFSSPLALLTSMSTQMESNYVNNRDYALATDNTNTICPFAPITDPTSGFIISCQPLNAGQSYLLRAVAPDYAYTIDNNGNRATTLFKGTASTATCWQKTADGDCFL